MTPTSDPRNIGFPVSSRAWVVNPSDYNELVPIGCVGELFLEGFITARGYLNDDEKTSRAFIESTKWAADRHFRGYLTGDLVSQNPDGSLSIVGRKDSQVVRLHSIAIVQLFHWSLTVLFRNIMVSVLNS